MLPIWSAAIDPRVLAVRAISPVDANGERVFDARSADTHMVSGPCAEHLLLDRGVDVFRLDVIQGTTLEGPVALRFELADDDRLPAQISTLGAYGRATVPASRHAQLGNRLLALQASDARHTGASLREIADIILGPGTWPGEGEHRKSLVRRMLVAGERMIGAGPRPILAGR